MVSHRYLTTYRILTIVALFTSASCFGEESRGVVLHQSIRPYAGVEDPLNKVLMVRGWPVKRVIYIVPGKGFRIIGEQGVMVSAAREGVVEWNSLQTDTMSYDWVTGCRLGWIQRSGAAEKDGANLGFMRVASLADIPDVLFALLDSAGLTWRWPHTRGDRIAMSIEDFPAGCGTTILVRQEAEGTWGVEVTSLNILHEEVIRARGHLRTIPESDKIFALPQDVKFTENMNDFREAVAEFAKGQAPARTRRLRLPETIVVKKLPDPNDEIGWDVFREILPKTQGPADPGEKEDAKQDRPGK